MRRNPQWASGSFKWPLVIVGQNEINPANQALRSHGSAERQGFPGNKSYSMLIYHGGKKWKKKMEKPHPDRPINENENTINLAKW